MKASFTIRAGWLLLLSCCFMINLSAQGNPVMRTNERGEQIIVFPDGRWQYFHQYQQGSHILFDPQDAPLSQQRQQLERYPVFTGKVVPFEEIIPITEDDAQKIAFRKAQLASSAAAIAQERADKATRRRSQLEAELDQARRRNQAGRIRDLEVRIEAAQEGERIALREAQLANVESARADAFVARGNYISELKAEQERAEKELLLAKQQDLLAGNFYEQLAFLDDMPYALQAPNRLTTAAVPACRLAYEGTDEYTGLQRMDVQKRLLFTHTDERLRLYLKDKDYLRCEGFLTSLAGGYRYLSLEFTFAYPNAREAYGFIEKGSYLVIKLMNGQAVYLQSGKMDQGSYDTEKELLTYRVHYPINQSVINTLRKGEVDNIRMYWSSGFEEYEVYYLNFFKDQIDCLEQKR
jgi:hypothetical protein